MRPRRESADSSTLTEYVRLQKIKDEVIFELDYLGQKLIRPPSAEYGHLHHSSLLEIHEDELANSLLGSRQVFMGDVHVVRRL